MCREPGTASVPLVFVSAVTRLAMREPVRRVPTRVLLALAEVELFLPPGERVADRLRRRPGAQGAAPNDVAQWGVR